MKVEIEQKDNKKLLTNYNKTVAYGVPASTNTRNPMYVTRTKKGKNGRTSRLFKKSFYCS